jgi:hypothetical protein
VTAPDTTEQAGRATDQKTKGAIRFGRFIMGANPTGRAIPIRIAALAINVSERTIDRWIDGSYSPDPGSRCVIESWTGGDVKLEWWETEEEKARIEYANALLPYGTKDGPQVKRTTRKARKAST